MSVRDKNLAEKFRKVRSPEPTRRVSWMNIISSARFTSGVVPVPWLTLFCARDGAELIGE